MNLKERGITVGDLLITILIIATTAILIKTFTKEKQTAFKVISQETLSYKEFILSKNNNL